MSTLPNKGKTITTQEIHELLDQNPSYTQMCEILEYRGFVINRSQFARVLLKAVPDLGTASNQSNTASNNTASPTSTATVSNKNTPTTSTTAANKMNTDTPPSGLFGKLVTATPTGSAAQSMAPSHLPFSVPPVTALQAPSRYATPYARSSPSAVQADEMYQRNGHPWEYPFAHHASWIPNDPRRSANVTTQNRQNKSALHSHSSFPPHQNPDLINGQVLDQEDSTSLNGIIPPQPTKQEMARKRTFGEIVDLTQKLSDEEDLERRGPKPRLENESASGPSKAVKDKLNQVAQRQQSSGRSTPKPFKYKYSGRDALLQSRDIIEPMNKRRDALRRSTYNPKTIARDVLLSIGKHPAMAPLNAHLDGLRDKFKAVDYESDVSTFRWDLVDPEGKDGAASPDSDEEEAVTAVTSAAPRHSAPTAIMINSDTGVAKDNHATRMVNSEQKSNSRGPYKKSSIHFAKPFGFSDIPQKPSPQGPPRAQLMGNVPSTNASALSRFAYDSSNAAQARLNVPSPNSPATASKRRGRPPGRPPGVKNKQVRPDKGAVRKTKTSSEIKTPSTAEENPSNEEAIRTKTLMGRASPVRNFTIGKTGTPIHNRPRSVTATPSRPKGLGDSISVRTPTNGIAVVIPSRSPSVVISTPQASAKKALPKKPEDFSQSTHSSMPSYTMCRCSWENCPAELHSIETLKKHVKKHRRAVDDVYPCLWADCSDSSNPISSNTHNEDRLHRRLIFKTDAEWIKHVESNHLDPEELFRSKPLQTLQVS